jgi:hypothetical protein
MAAAAELVGVREEWRLVPPRVEGLDNTGEVR